MCGYRKTACDLRGMGESCGKHRTARLLRQEGLRAQVGYRRRPSMRGGKLAIVANNQLARQFDPSIANRARLQALRERRAVEWVPSTSKSRGNGRMRQKSREVCPLVISSTDCRRSRLNRCSAFHVTTVPQ